jgi:hypothetical protein
MVVTVIITEISYRFIETPIRKGALSNILIRFRNPRDPRARTSRGPALLGAFVGTALAIFAGASLVTAELKQNAVEQSLDEGAQVTCDVVNDPNCDGTSESGGDVSGDPTADSVDVAATDVPATTVQGVAPVTTASATTTTSAAPVPIDNLALGDSVMLGAAGQLDGIGYVVDAEESRQFTNGVETVATLRADDRLGDRVVVHLGTNGPIGASSMTALMDELVDVPQVVLITNDVDRDYTAGNNALIYDAANAYANAEILDWQGLAPSCPGNCFYEDGIHLRPDGQAYYATLVGSITGLP